mmetsp:Transcript_91/g.153  ORF Transcript_91/g.153 Transcript_91/m.153 type:complete len:236 (+) Transcript_91:80-787(+)
MSIFVTEHPLIAEKMTRLRNKDTPPPDFRRKLKEITYFLGYEATRDLKSNPVSIETPVESFNGSKIADNVAIIPVLRAGLAMAEGMLELMPDAAVYHIGMYRAKESLLPIQYYNRLPRGKVCDVAYVLDPCIATANTVNAVVSILKRWGAKRVVVVSAIGSRPGVERLVKLHPDIEVHIGALDEVVNEAGYVVPGVGDAGDRQFGTLDEIPDLMPANPISPTGAQKKNKRKASES